MKILEITMNDWLAREGEARLVKRLMQLKSACIQPDHTIDR